MAEWKKIIVSGSDANLANLQVDSLSSGLVTGQAGNLTTTAVNGSGNILATTGATGVTIGALADSAFTGSFTGSFTGDGAGLTGVTATFPTTQNGALADGNKFFTNNGSNTFVSGTQVQDYVYNGVSGDITIAAGGAASIANNAVDTATLATSLGTLADNNFTGSFTGSFTGDGSGLTGLATTLTVGDESSTQTVDLVNDTLKFVDDDDTIETTVNKVGNNVEITASLAATIPGNRTFSGDTITVNNDLIVQGTASFQSTENLQVADQFILLNSGSTGAGPGGIVIEQGTDDIGEALAWSSTDSRWGVTGSFDAASTTFAPDAFVNFVIEGTANDPDAEVVAKYDKKGNMFVGNTGDIWIYV